MRLHNVRSWMLLTALVAAFGMPGCGGSKSPVGPSAESSGSGGSGSGGSNSGGGSTTSGSGHLTIGITDSPFSDATAVLVTFDGLSVHRSGQGWETVDFGNGATEWTCDLKNLEGPTDVLGSATLEAGHYTQIRLHVKSATIHFDNESATACAPSINVPGTQFTTVKVPSGEVKLNRQFTLDAGGTVMIVLDFDGNKSIRQQGGGGNGNGNGNGNGGGSSAPEEGSYSLQPVVSIVSVTNQ